MLLIGLLKKAIVDLPIKMKGDSKRTSGNSLGPRTKISALLRRRYRSSIASTTQARHRLFRVNENLLNVMLKKKLFRVDINQPT